MTTFRDRARKDAECNFTADLIGACGDCGKKMKPGSAVFFFGPSGESADNYVGECCVEKHLPKQ